MSVLYTVSGPKLKPVDWTEFELSPRMGLKPGNGGGLLLCCGLSEEEVAIIK